MGAIVNIATRTLQLLLVQAGYPIQVDGLADPRGETLTALADFEGKHPLPVVPQASASAATAVAAAAAVYAGFDSYAYPGDAAVDWLRANTNLTWCGAYLGGPSSSPASYRSWRAGLAHLRSTGWGIAPIYVGGQTIGPGSHDLRVERGAADGAEAASLMKSCGFLPGSVIYLDLENGTPFPGTEQAYVAAWARAVGAAGYRAGVYCSFSFAADVHRLVPDAPIWVFHVPTTAKHANVARAFPTGAKSPIGSGYPGASLWQHDDNVSIAVAGTTLVVDLDTALRPDPSAPLLAA